MLSLFMRCVLFVCSYLPLLAIICVLQYDVWPSWVIWSLAAGGGVVLLITLFSLWVMRRRGYGHKRKVVKFSRRDTEVMSYVASYLIPFVTFPLEKQKQIFTLLIFMGVLLVVYVRSNLIYINPVLNLFGYHLYEVEVENSKRPHYYIARKPLELEQEIYFVRLSDDIYLEK